MDNFSYSDDRLFWHGKDTVALFQQAAEKLQKDFEYAGHFWLYQEEILRERLALLENNLVGCGFYYSVKSQSNLALLRLIAAHARFGADVVSGGELLRTLKAGFPPEKIVFAGVGKSEAELRAALENKIRSIHVESISELKDIARIADELKLIAPVTLRLNPDVEVDTHKHITTGKEENKFGLSENDFQAALKLLGGLPALRLVGLQAHIGSQLFDTVPYIKTAEFLKKKSGIVSAALHVTLEYISLGGGFGIDYHRLEGDAVNFDFATLLTGVRKVLGDTIEIHFEPGRFIAAPLGVLATRVRHLKERSGKTLAIVDAAMNDLIRPMLYEAYHPILPIMRRAGEDKYDIVGPVCESTDTFASARTLSLLNEGDWLAIGYAGAYGSSMSSNFNSRPLIPEVLLTAKGGIRIIRRPQTLDEMFLTENFA